MNNKTVVATTIIIVLATQLSMLLPVVAVGYVVNWNVDFNTRQHWGEMVNQWNGQTSNYWGAAWVQLGVAHTKVSIYGGVWYNPCWANCWLGQGDTLWTPTGGYDFSPVPCTSSQWLIGESKLETAYHNWNGMTATYLNLWGTFNSPTGNRGYDKFEIVVYLSRSTGWFNLDFPNGATHYVEVTNEGDFNRYVVQYRVPSSMDIANGWRTYHINVADLFAGMSNVWNVDLELGTVTGLNVGNEACNGGSQAAHNYLYYYVE